MPFIYYCLHSIANFGLSYAQSYTIYMNKSPVVCYSLLILIKAMHAKSDANRHNFQSAHHSRRNAASILTRTNATHPTYIERGRFQRESIRSCTVYFAWACVCTCFFDTHIQSPQNPLRIHNPSLANTYIYKTRTWLVSDDGRARPSSVSVWAAKHAASVVQFH